MRESYLLYHDRLEKLQGVLEDIKKRGTISMESADIIEQLIPGEIGLVDQNVLFELEENEEQLPIAMEAGVEGLSKLKIAFIVAIIAFITRYIFNLNSNSYKFEVSGGGSGGWGGSAPPKFQVDTPPTDPKHWEAQQEYGQAVEKDIGEFVERYKDLLTKFDTEVLKSGKIKGMGQNKQVQKLINTIIPKIIANNDGESSKGFDLFNKKKREPMGVQWDCFRTGEKGVITEQQIKMLYPFLRTIRVEYSPENVFVRHYSEVDFTSKHTGITFPYFILNKDDKAKAVSLINLTTGLANQIPDFNSSLLEFKDAVKSEWSSEIDLHEGLGHANRLWKWLVANLYKNEGAETPIKKFIKDLTPIIDSEKNLDSSDSQYYNTMIRTRALKQFVKYSLNGSMSGGDESDYEFEQTNTLSKQFGETLFSFSKNGLLDLLKEILEPLDNVSNAFKENEAKINTFTDTVNDIESIIANAIGTLRDKNRHLTDYSNLGKSESVGLDQVDKNKVLDHADNEKVFPHMLNSVSGLVQLLLLTLASAAKFNNELTKLSKERCEKVIGKCQAMASEYAELNACLESIIREA